MSQVSEVGKAPGIVNLGEEIEIRQRLSVAFDSFLRELGGLSVSSVSDVEALALLLMETREALRRLTKEEEALKVELKRHLTGAVTDLGSVLVTRDSITRTDLDKKALTEAMGVEFVEKFTRHSTYEKVSVRRKG